MKKTPATEKWLLVPTVVTCCNMFVWEQKCQPDDFLATASFKMRLFHVGHVGCGA